MSKKPLINIIIALSLTGINLIMALVVQGWLYFTLGIFALILYIIGIVLLKKPETRTAALVLGLLGGVLSLISGIVALIATAIVADSAPDWLGLFVFLALFGFTAFLMSLLGFIIGMKEKSGQIKANPSPASEEPTISGDLSQAETLKKYKELLDSGAITPEEYEEKKKGILK
jgi:hypothetical protein